MPLDWNDLKLFLDVANSGGLTAASRVNGHSPATLGRHISALEVQIGEQLFVRSLNGYRLTEAGRELFDRSSDVMASIALVQDWRNARAGIHVVRLSSGHWTARFLAQNIADLWAGSDKIDIEFVTSNQKIDIAHRDADLGIRNARPTEKWLAGRIIGKVTFALYRGVGASFGKSADIFVGLAKTANSPSARWLEVHFGDKIRLRGNDSESIRRLIIAGAGMGVLPCFVGDMDQELVRASCIIPALTSEQWLVSHHELRHVGHVVKVSKKVVKLVNKNKDLFMGRTRDNEGCKDYLEVKF